MLFQSYSGRLPVRLWQENDVRCFSTHSTHVFPSIQNSYIADGHRFVQPTISVDVYHVESLSVSVTSVPPPPLCPRR